jgi:hypothetical protein
LVKRLLNVSLAPVEKNARVKVNSFVAASARCLRMDLYSSS